MFTSYNSVQIPSFMYGTAWKKDDTARLVELAVANGFKAIDTANQLIHYHEALVGTALQTLKDKGVSRDDLFLQTKFTPVNGQDHRTPYDASASITTQVAQSMDSSLKHLHTDHLDSYVLHGPYTRRGISDADREVWSAIERVYDQGKAKIIGVSNVSAEQLQKFCVEAKVKPMVVQNRCYAITGWDKEVRDICRTEKIIYQGFSLLTANTQVLSSSKMKALASKYGATTSQIVFRFAMQVGMLPLTGTTNPSHMKEDLQAASITLLPEEVSLIESIAV